MTFNIFSRNKALGLAAEVFMLGPVMMIADRLKYYSIRASIVEGEFIEDPMAPNQIAFLHSIYYSDRKMYPQYANLDYDDIVRSYNKLRNVKHPDKLTIIAQEKGRKLINVLRKDVQIYYDHYTKHYGFLLLKNFFQQGLFETDSAPMVNEFRMEKEDIDALVEQIRVMFAGEKQAVVMNQRLDKVLKVATMVNGETAKKAEALYFPLVNFPVLKRLNEQQGSVLFKNLSSVRSAFNQKFEEVQSIVAAMNYGKSDFGDLLGKHFTGIAGEMKITEEDIYLQQLTNAEVADGEVKIFVGVSSVENLLNSYKKMGAFSDEVLKKVWGKISSWVRPDQATLFLYVKVRAFEVEGDPEEFFKDEVRTS